jgi:hypothetical protein
MAGPFGTDLYAELEPLAYDDANQDNALLTYLDTIGSMFDEIEGYARDGPLGEPGWSIILDLSRAPEKALPWLGQFVGVRITEGLTLAQKVSQIQARGGFGRGTPLALVLAAQTFLTGGKTVVLRERDTSAYHLTVFTYTSETPDSAKVASALQAAKPAGLVLSYSVVAGGTYGGLLAGYATYDAVRTGFLTYQGVLNNVPGT